MWQGEQTLLSVHVNMRMRIRMQMQCGASRVVCASLSVRCRCGACSVGLQRVYTGHSTRTTTDDWPITYIRNRAGCKKRHKSKTQMQYMHARLAHFFLCRLGRDAHTANAVTPSPPLLLLGFVRSAA